MELLPNRVAECLDDKEVLLTGGTGYVGKVLLEKLLRSCPGLKRVFVLLRSKNGKDPRQRLQDLLDSPLFEKVRRIEGGSLLGKVFPMKGDVSAPDLGLNDEARHLLCSSVSVVFHSAATVRFDEPLKSATLLNTRGTLLLLQLARGMTKLQSFLHVSTAYCHPENKVFLEKVYLPPCDPHGLINFIENNSAQIIDTMTQKILGSFPNTYVFTKALGESLCEEFMDELPVVIVRPSIVIPIWKEPLVGWVDNLNGPVGVFMAAGKGVLRSTLADEEVATDFIPVDIVANAILLASWACMNNMLYEKHDKVYNITSYKSIRMTWSDIKDMGYKIADTISLENPLWYGSYNFTKWKFIHFTRMLLFQLLPAYFVDIAIRLAGYAPILMRIQRKVWRDISIIQFFIQTEWDFDNIKFNSLAGTLNSREKNIFYCTLEDFDMYQFFENSTKGAKLYILKESLENLPAARRQYRRRDVLVGQGDQSGLLFLGAVVCPLLCPGTLTWPIFTLIGVSNLKEYNWTHTEKYKQSKM